MNVTAGAAVIGAAVIIAASVVFAFRWEIATPNVNNVSFVIRLDRWTGTVALCPLHNVGDKQLAETGAEYNCEPVRQQEAAVLGSQTTGQQDAAIIGGHHSWQDDLLSGQDIPAGASSTQQHDTAPH